MREIERHTQRVLEQSPYVRSRFMEKLDTSSLPAYEKSAAEYRQIFAQDVIGQFDTELLPLQPRTRQFTETAAWTGYEVWAPTSWSWRSSGAAAGARGGCPTSTSVPATPGRESW